MTLYRFQVAAYPAGDVGLGKFTFRVSSSASSVTVSNLRLFAYSDSSFSVPAYAKNPLNSSSTQVLPDGSVEIYFNPIGQGGPEAIGVPAGAVRSFSLEGQVTTTGSNDSIRVALLGDGASVGADD